MSRGPLILGVGQVGMEIAGVVPRLPDTGSVEMEEITVQAGGPVAVAVATAAGLGCRGRIACKLAHDFAGGFVGRALSDAGIDTRVTLTIDSQLSGVRFTALDRGARRREYYTPGDVKPLLDSDLDLTSLLDDVAAVLIDGQCPSAQIAVAEAARKRKIPVIFDGTQIEVGAGTLVDLADVMICSERLAAELSRRDEIEETLVDIQRLGPNAVIITLGEAGAVGLHGDQLVKHSSFDVEVVDAQGAGWVYHGAFAAALLSNLPFVQCMQFAAAAAALSCRQRGAWLGIPNRDDVMNLVREQQC